MIRKTMIGALMLVALGSTAWAQTPKVEFTGLIGYTLADGVSGDPYKAGNGQTYDRVDPEDSVMYGFSLGFFLSPSAEIGFMWRRQPTELTVSGTSSAKLSDINIDGYHGYGAYYFGDPEAKARPYIMGGIGVTRYGDVSWTQAGGVQKSVERQFPVLDHLGRGPEGERNAERRHEVRCPVDADLHQVGRSRLVVRPVVGLLRRRQCPVREPVRVRRRALVPLLRRSQKTEARSKKRDRRGSSRDRPVVLLQAAPYAESRQPRSRIPSPCACRVPSPDSPFRQRARTGTRAARRPCGA